MADFAEKRIEQYDDDSGYTVRYLVYNGATIGSYGVHFTANGRPYGASRDYHELLSDEDAAKMRAFNESDDEDKWEGDKYVPYAGNYNECVYHDGKPCICDGSSLVEVITDDDKLAFGYAAWMAER